MKPSAAKGPTTVPLLGETISQNLARTVAAHGGRDALVSVEQGLRYTYTEFAEEVDRVARALMAVGVAAGGTRPRRGRPCAQRLGGDEPV